MSNIFLALITLAFLAAVGVFIVVMLELKTATQALREFLKTTEATLKPTLEELQQSLRSMRNVTDNVTAVTEDVKTLSSSVRKVGENVQHVSELIDDVTSSTAVKVSGLRAGIRTALEVLIQNLLTGRRK